MSCLCVLGRICFVPVFTIFRLEFGIISTVWYFLLCILSICFNEISTKSDDIKSWALFWYGNCCKYNSLIMSVLMSVWENLRGNHIKTTQIYRQECKQDIPIFHFGAYPMKVIPETRRAHSICYLRFQRTTTNKQNRRKKATIKIK